MSFTRKIAAAVIALGMAVGNASASLVASDLVSVGDGLVTLDTSTRLEWLDVSATVGQTVPSVLSGLFVNGLGFRFASRDEVLGLWRSSGASGPFVYDPKVESYAANFDGASLLIDLMGCTSDVLGVLCDGIDQNWHIGRYSLQGDPSDTGLAVVDSFGPPDYRAGTAAMLIDWGTLDPNFSQRPDIGNYLVRDARNVPEPSSVVLLLTGLFAAATTRRRAFTATPLASAWSRPMHVVKIRRSPGGEALLG